MEPVVDRLYERYEGAVAFAVLNPNDDPEFNRIANDYGIQYVPTFVFVDSDGVEVERLVGVVSEDVLADAIESIQ